MEKSNIDALFSSLGEITLSISFKLHKLVFSLAVILLNVLFKAFINNKITIVNHDNFYVYVIIAYHL